VAAAELGLQEIYEIFLPVFEAVEAGLFCLWCGKEELFAAVLPTVACFDDRQRLHCPDGPAFVWLEDLQSHYWHGVLLPDFVIEDPARITVEGIETERNAEVRRVMIERYSGGQAKYLLDSGAKQIQCDDYGALYRKPISGDEPIVMVKVVNSTPEPDGSFKDYFLRVPPTVKTAREAVAWTFEKSADDYTPAVQT
jgi:hypothetical protein